MTIHTSVIHPGRDWNLMQKDLVIAQMNYCIKAMTNIINSQSMTVLEYELDQLINNLTIEQIIGLYDIQEFRLKLLEEASSLQITQEERALLRRIQSIKGDNAKWTALSNALNPTLLLTGSGPGMVPQAIFQTLLTAARTAVEYKSMQGELDIEEIRAMWNLRKQDMEIIKALRQDAMEIVFKLYDKYHLDEYDRLTEATANMFSLCISEPDVNKRIRLLEEHRNDFEMLAEYYYYLGMGYLESGQYIKAKSCFDTYSDVYAKTPLFRCDEKGGTIALARLSYEKNLSQIEKKHLINIVLQNLPNNSAALLQCAMIYLYELEDETQCLNLLKKRSGQSLCHRPGASAHDSGRTDAGNDKAQ